ncbi:MAG: hypothetical protein JWQ44_2956 [Chthoniobacter sp.]|nr:hypothetical protein [Chthoniobacter sp.]
MTKNTCEQAFDLLAKRPDTIFRAATGTLQLRRRTHPAGSLSDGYRTYNIGPCPRMRYLIVDAGFQNLAEIDQRDHWDNPQAMTEAVLAAIPPALEELSPGFREELTPAGVQLVIPGCEREAPTKGRHTAQLSLW